MKNLGDERYTGAKLVELDKRDRSCTSAHCREVGRACNPAMYEAQLVVAATGEVVRSSLCCAAAGAFASRFELPFPLTSNVNLAGTPPIPRGAR